MTHPLGTARRVAIVALLAVASATCRDAGPETPNTLELRVVSPNGAEGAALVRLAGAIARVEATVPGWLLTDVVSDTTWVLLARDTPGDLSFRLELRAGGALSDAQLVQVAGPDDQVRPSTAGYRVEVR